jgi:hypothetical protein
MPPNPSHLTNQNALVLAVAQFIKTHANNNISDLNKNACKKARLGRTLRSKVAPAVFDRDLKIAEAAEELEKLAEMLLDC